MSIAENSTTHESRTLNNSETGTESGLTELDPGSLVIFTTICTLIITFGCIGNLLVILAVFKSENLRSVPDFFISSLAISDVIVCLLYLPLTILYYNNITYRASEEGYPFRVVRSFLGYCSLVASVNNIFAVTVDRVIAIRFPLKYPSVVTLKTALSAIISVWIIALMFGAVHAREIISRFVALGYNFTLMLITMIMYAYIFSIARRQENRVQTLSLPPRPQRRAMVRQKSEKKAAKTIFAIVGIYALCWLPLLLLPLIVNPSKNPVLFKKCFPWVQMISICNSALNPYVYCVRSHKYRREFKKLLRIKMSEGNNHSSCDPNNEGNDHSNFASNTTHC